MNRPLILVVDDNKITTKLLRRYLESNGFDVADAGDGVEALERIAERAPDAIIMDVMMPRLDGLQTAKRIKESESTKHIPIAIVTALNDLNTQVSAVEAGADDFLTKPIDEKLLLTKAGILTALSRSRQTIRSLNAVIDAFVAGNSTVAMELLNGVDRHL